MSDWSAGYVSDIGYTFGYYTELNPLRIKLAFLNNGLVYPEVGTACELGFGQGLSTNIHAAASVTKWYGTDFNPAQAAYARDLAEKSGADANLYDDSFSEFLARDDLPDFDYIGLHGIWSWVSDENRAVIVDFIKRKLKVGGVVYISYNTLPGWAAFAPMRHLMAEHADVIGAEGLGLVSRINNSIEFIERLLKTNPVFLRANPLVGDRIKKLKEQNRHYLAHEYFNRDWHPMHFSTIASWLETAKLQYACSAHYIEHIDTLNLSPEQQSLLREISDPTFRQSVFDFMVNQQFRRDYWVKGLRRLTSLEQSESLASQKVILVSHRPNISLKVTGALGEAEMSPDIYNPILDLLADYKARSLSEIFQALTTFGISFGQIVQASLILAGGGHLASVHDDAITAKAKLQTDRLNSALMNSSRSKGDVSYLASPVTGGGLSLTRLQQMFILAIKAGKKEPSEWASSTWETLCLQGEKLIISGSLLESPESNLAELNRQALDFASERLVILKSLQII